MKKVSSIKKNQFWGQAFPSGCTQFKLAKRESN